MRKRFRKYLGIKRTRIGDRLQEIEALERVSRLHVCEEDKHILNRIKRRIQDEIIFAEGKSKKVDIISGMTDMVDAAREERGIANE